MIKTFADRRTADIFAGRSVKKGFPNVIMDVARRKLDMIDSAPALESLKIPPSNKLHPLRGDRKAQHAIWINSQWRICFVWIGRDAYDVEITDYH